jgi:hypothetical protein
MFPSSYHKLWDVGILRRGLFMMKSQLRHSLVDRIINHLKLTFVAAKPPPTQVAYQEILMTAKAVTEYFS